MQFTCVTCSLPVETGKLTRVYAASNSRAISFRMYCSSEQFFHVLPLRKCLRQNFHFFDIFPPVDEFEKKL